MVLPRYISFKRELYWQIYSTFSLTPFSLISNLSKRLKLRLQASQNKCISFCLQLDKRSKIRVKEFLQSNWLNVHNRHLQFIGSDIFKFQNDQCPDYFNEIFCPVGENGVITRSSDKKLKLPFPKTKLGIQSLSYVGPKILYRVPWISHSIIGF